MYDNGEGVIEDNKEAVKWYRLAADQGDANSQLNLGWMYHYGEGVRRDEVTAYAWYNIAGSNGSADAQKNKSLIAKEMTRKQIVKAKKLSRELLKQIEERQKKAE